MMDVQTFDSPYRHWLLSRVLPRDVADRAAANIPTAAHSAWVRYANECEQKWTMNDRLAFGAAWAAVFDALNSPEFVRWLAGLTGVPELRPDPTLHGAGLHLSFAGSWLSPHLDGAIGPAGERRVNLILYLNREWRAEWGGATALCDLNGKSLARVMPQFNTALIWCPGDDTMHAGERIATGAPARLTAAAYYWTAPRPGVTRRRAMFLPRRA